MSGTNLSKLLRNLQKSMIVGGSNSAQTNKNQNTSSGTKKNETIFDTGKSSSSSTSGKTLFDNNSQPSQSSTVQTSSNLSTNLSKLLKNLQKITTGTSVNNSTSSKNNTQTVNTPSVNNNPTPSVNTQPTVNVKPSTPTVNTTIPLTEQAIKSPIIQNGAVIVNSTDNALTQINMERGKSTIVSFNGKRYELKNTVDMEFGVSKNLAIVGIIDNNPLIVGSNLTITDLDKDDKNMYISGHNMSFYNYGEKEDEKIYVSGKGTFMSQNIKGSKYPTAMSEMSFGDIKSKFGINLLQNTYNTSLPSNTYNQTWKTYNNTYFDIKANGDMIYFWPTTEGMIKFNVKAGNSDGKINITQDETGVVNITKDKNITIDYEKGPGTKNYKININNN